VRPILEGRIIRPTNRHAASILASGGNANPIFVWRLSTRVPNGLEGAPLMEHDSAPVVDAIKILSSRSEQPLWPNIANFTALTALAWSTIGPTFAPVAAFALFAALTGFTFFAWFAGRANFTALTALAWSTRRSHVSRRPWGSRLSTRAVSPILHNSKPGGYFVPQGNLQLRDSGPEVCDSCPRLSLD
jgi:hypothetical protein